MGLSAWAVVCMTRQGWKPVLRYTRRGLQPDLWSRTPMSVERKDERQAKSCIWSTHMPTAEQSRVWLGNTTQADAPTPTQTPRTSIRPHTRPVALSQVGQTVKIREG
jgi:hypothetical protein